MVFCDLECKHPPPIHYIYLSVKSSSLTHWRTIHNRRVFLGNYSIQSYTDPVAYLPPIKWPHLTCNSLIWNFEMYNVMPLQVFYKFHLLKEIRLTSWSSDTKTSRRIVLRFDLLSRTTRINCRNMYCKLCFNTYTNP